MEDLTTAKLKSLEDEVERRDRMLDEADQQMTEMDLRIKSLEDELEGRDRMLEEVHLRMTEMEAEKQRFAHSWKKWRNDLGEGTIRKTVSLLKLIWVLKAPILILLSVLLVGWTIYQIRRAIFNAIGALFVWWAIRNVRDYNASLAQ
jgi:hypothetical protein